MRALIDALPSVSKADYFLDTCFLFYFLKTEKMRRLNEFCSTHSVGMSSFNLAEIEHVHHKMDGTLNHHLRDFLKKKLVSSVAVDVNPGERDKEIAYVQEFDPKILSLVPDASDAVLFVQALKLRANLLTRDKHHLFTTRAENYLNEYGIEVLNELP
ncbi:MAG: PIN domain-containing protein [Candidatus Woesearchaeota archaeon]